MYTFAQPLTRALGTAAGSCAVVCQDRRRTYAELGTRCRRWPARCASSAWRRRTGLAWSPSTPTVTSSSTSGCPAAGYVLVPVNSRLAPAEMRAILDDAGVSVVFADAEYPGTARAWPGADHAR